MPKKILSFFVPCFIITALFVTTLYSEPDIPAYEKILETDPQNFQARYELAKSYLETGRYEEAEKILEFLTTLTADEIAGFKADQLLSFARGLWFYAGRVGDKNSCHLVVGTLLPKIEETLKKNQESEKAALVELYLFWGECYLEKGNITEAQRCFQDVLKINPQEARAYLRLAQSEFVREPEKPLLLVNKALELNPDLAEAYELRAMIHLVNERYEEALSDTNKALLINPNSVSFRGTRAGIYYLTNEMNKFKAECEDVLKINPKPAVFYLQLGNNCLRKLLYLEAQPFYEKAVEFDPKLWEAKAAMGMNYLRLGPESELKGKTILEKVFENDPFNVPVYNTLKVLDVLEDEFETVSSEHFRIKIHKDEKRLLSPYVINLLENSYGQFTKLYEFEPVQPLLFELIPRPSDFSVRSFGVPGVDFALGICFAKTFIALSPKAQEYQERRFHWGAVTVHEFMHVITLQLSNFRVPRWFTEGASVYAEKLYRPGWERELEMQIYQAYQQGQIQHLENFCEKRGFDLIHTYLFSSLIIEYIHRHYGMDKIIQMLKAFGAGKKQSDVFQECLGVSLQEFDRQFFNYFENEWITRIKIRKPVDLKTESVLRQRIEQNNKDAEALALLARILLAKKDYLEAQKMAQASLDIDSKNIPAHLALADIFYEKKRYGKSIEYFSKALNLGADDFETHFKLARSYLNEGQKDNAVKEFQAAKKCFPRYVKYRDNPYYHLAKIYKESGETDKLLNELEGLFAVDQEHFYFKKEADDSDEFLPRRELAELYYQKKQYDKMVNLLEEAVYLEPENLNLHSLLGKAYREKKDHRKAIRSDEAVLFLLKKLEPGEKRDRKISDFCCDIAENYLLLNDKVKARQVLEEAREIDSTNQRIQELLEKCQ